MKKPFDNDAIIALIFFSIFVYAVFNIDWASAQQRPLVDRCITYHQVFDREEMKNMEFAEKIAYVYLQIRARGNTTLTYEQWHAYSMMMKEQCENIKGYTI